MNSPAVMLRHERFAPGNIARLEVENLEKFGVYKRLHFQESVYTNLEEFRLAGSLARVLKDYGVGRGDRVLVMMPNSPELSAAFQAIWTLGAVIVPVMPQWVAEEVMDILRSAEPKVALTMPALAARIEQADTAVRSLQHLLVLGPTDASRSLDISQFLGSAPPLMDPADRGPSDLAVLLYTSGTTGAPKGVMLSHENLLAAVAGTYRQNPNPAPGMMIQALPLAHVFGLLVQNISNCWGWQTVLIRQFDPLLVLQAIERHHVNYLPAVPTMLVYLHQHPERQRFDMSSLTRVISGGAALPERLRLAVEHTFGCQISQGYGLSESASVATGYNFDSPYHPGSVGQAIPGVEISIMDDDNQSLPPGKVGEICLKGRAMMQGYWADPEATRNVFTDGRLRTGDLGYLDEAGYLFITDRKKDLIIKGGENVSPGEIEDTLHLHPAVLESAVIGMPNAVYGEEICAVVQLRAGAQVSEQEILEHVGRHVTKFKVPARVVFVPVLPRNASGKILKRKIRAQLLNKSSAQA